MPYNTLASHAMPRPMAKITTVRRSTFRSDAAENSKLYFLSENQVLTPIINIKNGNTRSVGVSPCHSACRRGA